MIVGLFHLEDTCNYSRSSHLKCSECAVPDTNFLLHIEKLVQWVTFSKLVGALHTKLTSLSFMWCVRLGFGSVVAAASLYWYFSVGSLYLRHSKGWGLLSAMLALRRSRYLKYFLAGGVAVSSAVSWHANGKRLENIGVVRFARAGITVSNLTQESSRGSGSGYEYYWICRFGWSGSPCRKLNFEGMALHWRVSRTFGITCLLKYDLAESASVWWSWVRYCFRL